MRWLNWDVRQLTRPNPKGKVVFKSLPSVPGFVPFSVSIYRSGIKFSGSSKSANRKDFDQKKVEQQRRYTWVVENAPWNDY
jgi:hypothetical protein